ncbi:MAG: acetylornithine transaminase [Acidothermus cellulolyticus]|nr:acetylornithine transaminase [Acidothermus cellulolyticus]
MTTTAHDELLAGFAEVFMPTYAPTLAIDHGVGCTVVDVDGRRYLDLIGGIAVSALGHAHPAIVDAVCGQVRRIAHTSNLYAHAPGVALARRLIELAAPDGDARVFLANSGAEANEAAIKLARKVAGPARPVFVAAEQAFHGRTLGALALTAKPAFREPFAPFGLEVRFVPYGDVDALSRAVTGQVGAVVLEPILGEAGVIVPPDGYLRAAREICDRAGAALIIDEIQTGIGRTGTWFAYQREGIRPDILTLAKGLGGGLPIGACIGFGRYATGFAKGDHGSTFGANPIACAAALAVLQTIADDDLIGHVAAVGDRLRAGITGLGHPAIAEVRGRGLLIGIALRDLPAPAVEAACRRAGFLVNAIAPHTIRLAPPLIVSAAEVDWFITALPGILEEVVGS